jgi:hypothetical protein
MCLAIQALRADSDMELSGFQKTVKTHDTSKDLDLISGCLVTILV